MSHSDKVTKNFKFQKKKSFLVGFKISANGLCMFKIQLFDLELSFLFLTEIQKKH